MPWMWLLGITSVMVYCWSSTRDLTPHTFDTAAHRRLLSSLSNKSQTLRVPSSIAFPGKSDGHPSSRRRSIWHRFGLTPWFLRMLDLGLVFLTTQKENTSKGFSCHFSSAGDFKHVNRARRTHTVTMRSITCAVHLRYSECWSTVSLSLDKKLSPECGSV